MTMNHLVSLRNKQDVSKVIPHTTYSLFCLGV